ncbi:S10 family peptidase [Caulobacter sp. NIBR2454]|uniref:S10 family peptidase n=1 Tax=Caulobacter sp. NIBR2454 TaxID=3015996 RepID=UPI0022B74247|nr:hypothetical protein [Caulobacter sp. NIBR2454]
MKRLVLGAAALILASGSALAQASPPIELAVSANNDRPVVAAPAPPVSFVTKHRTTIRGRKIDYTTTAGETYLTTLSGEPTGSIFSFAYVKDGPRDPNRPVMFVFNGGPGSASLWLHMGVVGPRRVVLDREVNPSNVPPFGVADNPDSLLDVADLVFIDPVGTGFSRAVGSGKAEDFWGVDQDADSVAQFIELWLSANGRWTSPKFLMGESYGSVRAALLPRALMGGPTYLGVMRGITVNGIILLGTTLDSRDGPPKPDAAIASAANDLTAQAAVAWAHGRTKHQDKSLPVFQAEVDRFAAAQFEDALRRNGAGTLGSAERQAIVERISGYTGLPTEAYDRDLKLATGQFARQLLADQGLSVGLYDGRYTLPTAGSGNEPVADDPAMGRYVPGFVAAFHQMLRDDLKVSMSRPYGAIVWRDLLSKWKWSRAQVPVGQSFAVDLATAMRRNQHLQVLVASGNYDLVTTPAAARRSLAAANLPADRVTFRDYPSGHMLYLGDTAAAFSDDVRALVRRSVVGEGHGSSPGGSREK